MASAVYNGDAVRAKQLLDEGVPPNHIMPENLGHSFLTFACLQGHLPVVQILIEAGAHINRKDSFRTSSGTDAGYYPLMAGCNARDHAPEIAKYLLEHGAKVDLAHPSGRDGAIHFAAMRGDSAVVKLLLDEGVNVNQPGSYGSTPLTLALHMNSTSNLVRMLLNAGAEIDSSPNKPNPLFELIAGWLDEADLARLFIDHGVPTTDASGSAIVQAASRGKTAILKTLLENKPLSSPDTTDAVLAAMKGQHFDAVEFLLRHGADPNAAERFEGTLLRQATRAGNTKLVSLIRLKQKEKSETRNTGAMLAAAENGDLAMMRLLFESGLPIDEVHDGEVWGSKKETPLMRAAARGRMEAVEYLMLHGASVDAVDEKGNTPLMYAAAAGQTEAIGYLLDHGASIDSTNHLNWNALMQACFTGKESAARLLLERGSRTDPIDLEKGATALSLARMSENTNLVKMLEERGVTDRLRRRRASNQQYAGIADCDICTYMAPRQELTHSYTPEKTEDLLIIHEEGSVDYKQEITRMIKKCKECGTYYYHYHFIDTEDSIGGAGPICSHYLIRLNLLWALDLFSKLEKTGELGELNQRYSQLIESFAILLRAENHIIPPYVLPTVVESLNDFYVMKSSWNSIVTLLCHPTIAVLTLEDILRVFGENARDDTYPPFTPYRNFTKDAHDKMRKLLRKNQKEFREHLNRIARSCDQKTSDFFLRTAQAYKIG
ncbi:MAG TPA: ankyrin repeat domain-containing protein [Leptospiraceae bacterium]|nr:ankyrin repeat domain-containing protein [Leptospiraceae bacterium]